MQAGKLILSNYRCYRRAELEFAPGVNIICGPNAAGKTNLLEALYFFSSLKPLRPVKEKEMVLRGTSYAAMTLDCLSGGRGKNLQATLSASCGRRLQCNGVTIRKNADFIGNFTTVIFSPDDLFLVKGAASERRRLLDRAICQLRPAYYSALSRYGELLLQKQRLLKQLEEKPEMQDLIPAYNQELAAYGAKLIAVRRSYIKKFGIYAARFAALLSGGKDVLSVDYQTVSAVPSEEEDTDALREILTDHFEKMRKTEIAARSCLTGPHKDDLIIAVNGVSARQFASQGQARTASLALKMAEREISYLDTGEYPVLLLDDVLSELDPERQNGVLNRAADGQILITCCSEEQMPISGRKFTIEAGEVRKTEEL